MLCWLPMHFLLKLLKKAIPERHPLRLLWHKGKAFAAALRYGFPARRLSVIGITGTDGKTTTVCMMAHILRDTGHGAGAVTTTHFAIGETVERNATQKTSISPFTLQRLLRRMVRAGCTHAVVEVSSHGLVQGRVNHISPTVAAVTNLAPEHLDYHGTMEQYTRDKGLLFRMLKGTGTKVLNKLDASFGVYDAIPSQRTISYGTSEGDLSSTDVHTLESGVEARVHWQGKETHVLRLSIAGIFNVENALCAAGCALALGIPLPRSLQALASFQGVPGRLEEVKEGQPFRVFLDFTVTVQAYEKILATLRAMAGSGRLLVLTSACGNRMREKRPLLGKTVSTLADVTVVTSDETYGEPHEKIIAEIWSGIDQSRTKAHRIPDRREAISFLLREAKPGDIVAVCGMAGVTTMMTEHGQIPWDEGMIVRELLEKMRKLK